jgi:hypothetical protein
MPLLSGRGMGYGGGMRWLTWIYQFAILVGVTGFLMSHGLNNGYAAGLLGMGAAWSATVVPLWVIDRVRYGWGKGTAGRSHQSGTELDHPAERPQPSEAFAPAPARAQLRPSQRLSAVQIYPPERS